MSRFNECWDRVDRAEFHAKTLVDACEIALDQKAYKIVPQLRNERDGSLVIVPHKAVDVRSLSFELGEYFYQLRAALDSLMWLAYELWGLSDDTANLEKLYFPIITASGTVKKATFNAVKLPEKLHDWLRRIQPSFAPQRTKDSDESTLSDTLNAINSCASLDRHRKLHLVGAYITHSSAEVHPTLPARLVDLRTITTGDYFKGEFTVAEFTIEGWTAGTQVRGEGKFAIHVSVDQIPRSMGDNLRDQLKVMANNTRFIIQKFDRYV